MFNNSSRLFWQAISAIALIASTYPGILNFYLESLLQAYSQQLEVESSSIINPTNTWFVSL